MLKRISKIARNKYLLSAVLFVVWMIFFDRHDLLTQIHNRSTVNELVEDKEYYKQEIAKSKKNTTELMTNTENLEKFAREKYYMKKDNEEVFVFTFENEE